jgi:quinol monooxygenase YgiN
MIKRIVRMQFRKKAVTAFLEIFRESCESIRSSDGCMYLELMQDDDVPSTYFTLSVWKDAEALQAYRDSKLFKKTWKRTRKLFRKKASAWSTTSYLTL